MSDEQADSMGFEGDGSQWLEIISDEDLDFWQRIEPNLVPQTADAVRQLYARYVENRWRQGRTYLALEEWMYKVMMIGLEQEQRKCCVAELQIRQSLAGHLKGIGPVRIGPKERKNK